MGTVTLGECSKRGAWVGMAAAALVLAGPACGSDTEPAGCDDACETGASSGAADDDGGGTADTGPGGSDDATAGEQIPCDVQDVLATQCWSCHSDPPMFGATMPLRTLEDFRVPAVTEPAVSVADLVVTRLADTDRPMPPDSAIDDEARGVLESWIAAGAPGEAAAECEGVADDGDDGDEPWGPENLPCEPDEVFLAYANDSDDGFAVPQVDDLYQCFAFDSPFTDETQGIAWAPIIDDARVVHHWLLLRGDASLENGAYPCDAIGLDTAMIMGWAPGTPNFVMPDDAGLELPGPGEKVILQIHYNNSAGHADVVDKSGVAMCTTDEPRENAASTLWLGSLLIDVPPGGSQEVVGDCDTTRLDEPVNVLLNWPHMHETGTSIQTELIRGGTDEPEMLVSVPNWNFDNQIYYPHSPAVRVEPGDILRTTCNFENPTNSTVTFGEGTGDEMCFDFAIVYPITAFDVPNLFGPPELGRYCVETGQDLPW